MNGNCKIRKGKLFPLVTGQFGEENTEFRASREQKEGIEYLWGHKEGSRKRRSQ